MLCFKRGFCNLALGGWKRGVGEGWGGVGEGGWGRVREGLAFYTSKTLFEKKRLDSLEFLHFTVPSSHG